MASVELKNIDKVFQGRRERVSALRDVSFRAEDQELVVLVGPSGCGKTTALRVMAGLEAPTAGTVRMADRDVTSLAPKDRNVAMVFQNYALYPHMTVCKNMAFGLKVRGVPREEIQKKVRHAAAMLGLSDMLDRRPAALSGGECQRVALGRAMVRDADLFLLDEPLSHLDPGLRGDMRREIKALQGRMASTMVYVTHDQHEAMTLGQRLVIMNRGVVQQRGEPLEIYRRPANRFVAGFIGTPPMNFVHGRITRRNDGAMFTSSCLRLPVERIAGRAVPIDADCDVVLGVRPHDVEVMTSIGEPGRGSAAAACVDARLASIEPLGNETHVNLVTSHGAPLVARAAADFTGLPGSPVRVALDLNRLHLFFADEPGGRIG